MLYCLSTVTAFINEQVHVVLENVKHGVVIVGAGRILKAINPVDSSSASKSVLVNRMVLNKARSA